MNGIATETINHGLGSDVRKNGRHFLVCCHKNARPIHFWYSVPFIKSVYLQLFSQ